MDCTDKYLKMNVAASKLTGYFGALAIYDSQISRETKQNMLNFLIEVWKETEPESKMVQEWIERWEKEKKETSI
jgi:hypothetical protein